MALNALVKLDELTYDMFFDGSSRPLFNGRCSSAFVITLHGKVITDGAERIGDFNDALIAEWKGLINGLKTACKLGIKHLRVCGDCKSVIACMTNRRTQQHETMYPKMLAKSIKLRQDVRILYTIACAYAIQFKTLEFFLINRKSNSYCDRLARRVGGEEELPLPDN